MAKFDTSHVSSCIVGMSAATVGTLALLHTDFTRTDMAVFGGGYQRAVERSFDDNIPLRALSVHGWNALKLGLLNQPSAGAFIGTSGRMFTTQELVTPASEFHFMTELLAAKTALETRNITLLPVVIPDKSRIYADELGPARAPELMSRYGAILDEINAANLATVDLSIAFGTAKQNVEVYMWTDTHWSPEGAEIAAQYIASELAQHTLEHTEFATTKSAPDPFEGDLVSFAATGPFRDIVGPRFETITPYDTVATSPPADLFGDVQIPLALVGTSFSDRTEFHFDGFLKQQTGLDLINYAKSGLGPFQPMRDFLASDALESAPPSIVIWEIPERYISPEDLS